MAVTVVIAGGGTGGHLYPGIAVARELMRRDPANRVTFAGTARGLEARVVPREGFTLDMIRSAGLKGKSWTSRLRGAALVVPSLMDAAAILRRRRPDVVVGVGGYSSGPVVLMAALSGCPTLVLEQNAAPGLTNRLLARVVRAAAVTYDETLAYFGRKGITTGNPVRAEFFAPLTGDERPHDRRRVLIVGGSQGAHAINMAMVAAVPELVRRQTSLDVVHQTGERDLGEVRQQYDRVHAGVRASAFLDLMADEMRRADLVVSRAGATTLAELAAAGRPAVLIPFGAATDDHQRKNAQVLAEAGAAVVIDERELTPARVVSVISGLLDDPARLQAMSRAIRALARPDAAARIVDRVLALGARPGSPRAEVRA